MKNLFKFTSYAFIACSFVLASCGDDDDNELVGGNAPSTEDVMPGGLPTSIGGNAFTTNANGQLTKVGSGEDAVTFEYGTFLADGKVFSVRINDDDDYIYCQTNAQGYVTYAYEVYDDGDTDGWNFEYNAAGQLTKLSRTEGNYVCNITYENGDITKVVSEENESDEDGDYFYKSEYTFTYTNSEFSTKVPNKGNLMLFDTFYQIDMDEMEVAYFAGLLGKATTNLPMGYTEKYTSTSYNNTYSETYNWEFNDNQLPTKFWTSDDPYYKMTFVW